MQSLIFILDEEITNDVENDLSIISGLEHPNVTPYESFFFTKLQGATYVGLIRPYFKTWISDVANFAKFKATDGEIWEKLINGLSYIHDKYSVVLNLK